MFSFCCTGNRTTFSHRLELLGLFPGFSSMQTSYSKLRVSEPTLDLMCSRVRQQRLQGLWRPLSTTYPPDLPKPSQTRSKLSPEFWKIFRAVGSSDAPSNMRLIIKPLNHHTKLWEHADTESVRAASEITISCEHGLSRGCDSRISQLASHWCLQT